MPILSMKTRGLDPDVISTVLRVPAIPALDIYPESDQIPDELEEYQSRVIIIEI